MVALFFERVGARFPRHLSTQQARQPQRQAREGSLDVARRGGPRGFLFIETSKVVVPKQVLLISSIRYLDWFRIINGGMVSQGIKRRRGSEVPAWNLEERIEPA
jgi:hypothetical protein